ncbi:hypothetical protein UlMin_041112 [Ulmus minor]
MATSPPPPLNLCVVLSESKRIINAHSRHFLALSVLFLLPLSFSFIVFPTLQNLLTDPTPNNSKIFINLSDSGPLDDPSIIPTKTLLLALAYGIFTFVFSVCAAGSITYSVFHGFYGRPVKLISAIKSVFSSFFSLSGTVLLANLFLSIIVIILAMFVFLVISLVQLMGFQIETSSPFVIGFFVAIMILFGVVCLHLQVNWILVYVIVVVESRWGLESLRRSVSLIKGLKGVAISLLLFFGFFASVVLFWSSSYSAVDLNINTDGWKSWGFVVQIVGTSTFLTLVLLYYFAANTVLYMYCKAVHGELAMEIAEEFAREYVSLPFDDGKVPHVVSVACP